MVKRVSANWLADSEHEAMDHVFEHIGVTWPSEERERLLQIASKTAFPSDQRAEAWKGYDQTQSTSEKVYYYPITASLTDAPSVWFHNLRLLQIRKKLNLVTSVRVGLTEPSIIAGEVLAKTQALELVVGKYMMSRASIPKMRKPHMSAVRATALRNAGLRARENRAQLP